MGELELHVITLVSKNLSRRKGRSFFSSVGLILAIAVIISVSTITRSMEVQIGDEIEKYGPNIIVTAKTESISVPYGSVVIGDVTIPEDFVSKIYTIPNKQNLRVVSPKLYGQVQYGNNSLLLVGIVPEREIELKRWWSITGSLPQNDTNEIIVGSAIKSLLGLTIGSTIEVKNITLTVAGFLMETGSVDDYSIFLPLWTAQRLLNLINQVSIIDVGAICKDCPVEVISQQIMDSIPGVKATPVKQAVETRIKAVEQTANFSLLLASIILVVGCASVMNTMLASVHERIKEIGIFMSLGADNSHLYKMFLLESMILGLVSGLIGAIVGLISSMVIGPTFIEVTINLTEIPIYTIPFAIILSVSACLIASFYPAWRASKIDPVTALRSV